MKRVILSFSAIIVSDVSDEDAISMALAKLWLQTPRPEPCGIRVMEIEKEEEPKVSILSQVREQVVHKGKLRYGAASRLASLLGLSQYAVRRVILGDRGLEPTHITTLEIALHTNTPLYTVRAKDTRCSITGCKAPGHADGKCRRHYYQVWATGISGN